MDQSRMLATQYSVLRGEFPLTAEFRSGPRNFKPSYDDWVESQNMPHGYPVDLQTNVLRFAPENYKYANRFAEEHPETMVLSTWRAASGMPRGAPDNGDPLGVSTIEFPGHWVLSPGTILSSNISPGDEILYVQSTENMRRGPALLVEIDSNGNKNWANFEYVLIQSVGTNDVEVRREYNGSPAARDFTAGRTYLAPIPWDKRNRKPHTDWFFNLSADCPRDSQGRTAMDVLLRDMIDPLDFGGPLGNIGGVDLASGPLTVNPEFADYDLDGAVDPSSVYRDGIETFYRRIRDTLGPDRVLTTSLDYEFLDYINGVNQEGLANPDDPWEEVTRTVNNVLAWQKLAKLPVVGLAFQQHFDREEDLLRVQLQRLLSGYSVCLGMAADLGAGSSSEALDALNRIELYKGDEKERHWLGRALGVKRPAAMMPNLLNGASSPTDFDGMLPSLSVLRGELVIDGDELLLRPDSGDFPGYVTLDLNFDLEQKTDFTVFMEIKSDDDSLLREILLPRVSVDVDSGPTRADFTNKAYLPLTFYVRGARPGRVTIDFRFDGKGDIRFKSLSVHAAADTLACEFEKGVVLVNPSLEDVNLDLPKIFPGRGGYRRLSASEPEGASDIPSEYRPQLRQAMEMNNGERVDSPWSLQIPQRNALFLVASEVGMAVDDAEQYSAKEEEPPIEVATYSSEAPPEPEESEQIEEIVEDEPVDVIAESEDSSASAAADVDANAESGYASDSTTDSSVAPPEPEEESNQIQEAVEDGPVNVVAESEDASASAAADEDTNAESGYANDPTTTDSSAAPASAAADKDTNAESGYANDSTTDESVAPPEPEEESNQIQETVQDEQPVNVVVASEGASASAAAEEASNADSEEANVSVADKEASSDSIMGMASAQTEESATNQKNITMGDLGAIIAFAVVSAVLAISFFVWRKRRATNSSQSAQSKWSRFEERHRDTIVMGQSFSGDDSSGSDSSAEIIEAGVSVSSPASNQVSIDAIAPQRLPEGIEVSIDRSIHEAADATHRAVEAGLWPDDVMPLGSFRVPASGPRDSRCEV